MPAYKDNVHNTWYCMFYFEDWTGQKKKKKKCGFKTKKEALEWENEFKFTANANMDMKLVDFIEIYFRDKSGELKERTIKNKRYMIENRIIPYFGERRVNEITPSDVIQWQTEMKKMDFSDSYLRMLQNQMTALFTHASKIYNLKNNPCKKVMVYDDNRILVQDRMNPDWPGITFPGGHIEPKESFVESVIREVKEETGLDISNVQLCGMKQWTHREGKYRYIVFFYKTNTYSGELKSSDEGKVFWIDRDKLNEYTLAEGFDGMFEVFANDNLSENYHWFENNEWNMENK